MLPNQLTDEKALILLQEFAKVDCEALNLVVLLENTKEFGEFDMILSKIHSYIRDHSKDV